MSGKYRVFIDGQAGTTGLQIHERLSQRGDIELLEIAAADRKNPEAKQALIESADVVVLCLPDAAAVETVALSQQSGANNVRFIDASTAHRVDPDWTYGLAELSDGQREAVAASRFVSNPGCYPTGFLLAVTPLIESGLLDPETLLTINAISGYSGGGRQLIEKYEARRDDDDIWPVRPYALSLQHKHIPEMTRYAGLSHAPIFIPAVGHFHQGMLVSVPLFSSYFKGPMSPDTISKVLTERYADEDCITVYPANGSDVLEEGFLNPQAANGTNRVDIMVFGHEDQVVVTTRLDNLGKGASGAAVQNLNLMLGVNELEGLSL